jgi:RNA polymerase sigma-70 factor (ECF subfamily)
MTDFFAMSFRLTGRRTEAEDLTQDICTKLPVKITSYTARAQFSTWLYRVIVNAAHDQRRRLARQETLSPGWGDWELARKAENQAAVQITTGLFPPCKAWQLSCVKRWRWF